MIQDNKIIGSLIGCHAGETVGEIFNRKTLDIERYGKTFWLVNSTKISPFEIQKNLSNNSDITYCYFLFTGILKNNTKPTKVKEEVKFFSIDNKNWNNLPQKISPVTGKINKKTSVFVFDKIEFINEFIDLWNYVDNTNNPINIKIWCSTFYGNYSEELKVGMKSRTRKVIARARLCKPYCVFVKK